MEQKTSPPRKRIYRKRERSCLVDWIYDHRSKFGTMAMRVRRCILLSQLRSYHGRPATVLRDSALRIQM